MSTKTYKVTGCFEGVVYALYTNGLLTMATAELDNYVTAIPGSDSLPLKEVALLNDEALTVKELVGKTVADKVALFCLKYKEYKGQPYRAQKQEKANMVTVTVNEQLLATYFTSTQYPLTHVKSMADYVRHYNTVRDLATNGKPVKSSFPDHPDGEYEKMLSPEKLSAYRMHLVKIGWKKVDGLWQKLER